MHLPKKSFVTVLPLTVLNFAWWLVFVLLWILAWMQCLSTCITYFTIFIIEAQTVEPFSMFWSTPSILVLLALLTHNLSILGVDYSKLSLPIVLLIHIRSIILTSKQPSLQDCYCYAVNGTIFLTFSPSDYWKRPLCHLFSATSLTKKKSPHLLPLCCYKIITFHS